jgi:hypothetical protein
MNKRRRYKAKRRREVNRLEHIARRSFTYSERRAAIDKLRQRGVRLALY